MGGCGGRFSHQDKKEVANVFAPNETANHFAWLYQKAILFQNVFRKYFKEFTKQHGQENAPAS